MGVNVCLFGCVWVALQLGDAGVRREQPARELGVNQAWARPASALSSRPTSAQRGAKAASDFAESF